MRKLYILIILIVATMGANAQIEQIVDLQGRYLSVGTQQWHAMVAQKQAGDTLQLPFVDDFSYRSFYPDTALWINRQVYINNDYPTNKISYGVATFDGIDSIGKPYKVGNSGSNNGGADTLTSKPIDLSALPLGVGDSVYFSFSYEPMGLGDYPDKGDSLMLEFSLNDTTWVTVWAVDGFASRPIDPTFTQVFVLLDNLFYFRNDFRFRFRNRATITGNNDHWHLDYVYMDANRTITDTVLRDITVLEEPTTLLKNFTMMPWNQFKGYEATETNADVTLCYRNNFAASSSIDFRYQAFSQINGSAQNQLFSSQQFNFNALPQSDSCFTFAASGYLTPLEAISAVDNDSVLVTLKTFVTNIGDISRNNDTVINEVEFYNLLAYDDGTAEKGYGLAGAAGLKRFAMEFTLNEPDTLRAVMIHFTRINEDVSNELFSFFVWKTLDVNNTGVTEDTLYSIDFQRPIYVDRFNGFATFALPEPLLVDGTFYVGWQQVSEKNLQVGMDIQNSAMGHMYYFSNNTWFGSQVIGAPMIRPLLGKWVQLTGVVEPVASASASTIKVYPNPASNVLYIDLPNQEEVTIKIFDVSGRLMVEQTRLSNSIGTQQLPSGMYVVQVMDKKGTYRRTARFIKL